MAIKGFFAILILFSIISECLPGAYGEKVVFSPFSSQGEASGLNDVTSGFKPNGNMGGQEHVVNAAALETYLVPVCCTLVPPSGGHLPDAILHVASGYEKIFMSVMGVLIPIVGYKYLNTDTNPFRDNDRATRVFLVAIVVALSAWVKIASRNTSNLPITTNETTPLMSNNIASRNTSDLPITSNKTTPPMSDIITYCIFLISGSVAQFCLLYILLPSVAWLRFCTPLYLFHEILSRSSYYYQKVVEWLCGMPSRVFNILQSSYYYQNAVEWLRGMPSRVLNKFLQIFCPPQQGRNDAPATVG